VTKIREFGDWLATEIREGETDPQVLTARYVEYVAGCVARQQRISDLRRQVAAASTELDQLKADDERGTHFHLTVSDIDPKAVAVSFRQLVETDSHRGLA
jgi:hypothetical protein